MQKLQFRAAMKLTAPSPFALVSTISEDGKPNIMALSWWTFAAGNPPSIIICTSVRGYTGELLKQNPEFALCLVKESVKDAAFKCGTCSGRSVDKVKDFGIELIDASEIAPKLVKESSVAFECKVTNVMEAGDHFVFVAEVLASWGDPEAKSLFAIDGYGKLTTV